MSRLPDAELQRFIDRLRRERVAAGLPEYIDSERLHRIIGHVLATHAARTRKGAHGGSGRPADRTAADENDRAGS
jgi:hypothetical protein